MTWTAVTGATKYKIERTEESIRPRGYVDFSSIYNNYSGIFNAPTSVRELKAFVALTADGSISAWGNSSYGGATPAGTGYSIK